MFQWKQTHNTMCQINPTVTDFKYLDFTPLIYTTHPEKIEDALYTHNYKKSTIILFHVGSAKYETVSINEHRHISSKQVLQGMCDYLCDANNYKFVGQYRRSRSTSIAKYVTKNTLIRLIISDIIDMGKRHKDDFYLHVLLSNGQTLIITA